MVYMCVCLPVSNGNGMVRGRTKLVICVTFVLTILLHYVCVIISGCNREAAAEADMIRERQMK